MADRVYLLQARDQLRDELAATERLVEILRDGLVAIEALLERASPVITEKVPVPPSSGDPHPASPDPSVPEPDPNRPRGSEAVERLLTEEPDRWFKVQDLTARQIERGWKPSGRDPVSAVRAAANRLVRDQPDRFERAHGNYRYMGVPQSRDDQNPQAVTPTELASSPNGSTSPVGAEVDPVVT